MFLNVKYLYLQLKKKKIGIIAAYSKLTSPQKIGATWDKSGFVRLLRVTN